MLYDNATSGRNGAALAMKITDTIDKFEFVGLTPDMTDSQAVLYALMLVTLGVFHYYYAPDERAQAGRDFAKLIEQNAGRL